ncbi:hypothetical protein EDD22DRAFT_1050288 [Suillus occidentalis]|nr:hypothetical protein EDD22DRAFT_1050288 [Suillus occidentalis]
MQYVCLPLIEINGRPVAMPFRDAKQLVYGLPSSPHTSSQVTHPSNLLPPASGSYVPYMPPPPFENVTTMVNNTQPAAGSRKQKSTVAASGTKAQTRMKMRIFSSLRGNATTTLNFHCKRSNRLLIFLVFASVTRYHALPCSLARPMSTKSSFTGMFFDGVTTRVVIDQLLLQPSDSPDGALRTFLNFAPGAESFLDLPASAASIEKKLTKHCSPLLVNTCLPLAIAAQCHDQDFSGGPLISEINGKYRPSILFSDNSSMATRKFVNSGSGDHGYSGLEAATCKSNHELVLHSGTTKGSGVTTVESPSAPWEPPSRRTWSRLQNAVITTLLKSDLAGIED